MKCHTCRKGWIDIDVAGEVSYDICPDCNGTGVAPMTASPIRDSAGKLAITPGAWRHVHTLDYSQGVYSDNGKAPLESIKYEGLYLANMADGDLFAEAGTITNQTGKTPAELAALVRELRGWIKATIHLSGYSRELVAMQKTIAESEGV